MALTTEEARERQQKIGWILFGIAMAAFLGMILRNAILAGPIGAPCKENGNCRSELCLRVGTNLAPRPDPAHPEDKRAYFLPTGGNYCTAKCKAQADCPAGFFCGSVKSSPESKALPIGIPDDATDDNACLRGPARE